MLNKNNATDNKIKNLESEVQKFKVYQASSTPNTSITMEANFEHILNEIKERETRSKNVIIIGVKEPISDNKDEHKKIDSSEKKIYIHVLNLLNNQNFFYNKQYGFRPKSNTLSATIDIVTKIKLCIDKKQEALGVSIDLKRAFDTVSYELLLKKLNEIGIKESAFKVLESYFTNRSQIVKVKETQSNPQNITYGVPQG